MLACGKGNAHSGKKAAAGMIGFFGHITSPIGSSLPDKHS